MHIKISNYYFIFAYSSYFKEVRYSLYSYSYKNILWQLFVLDAGKFLKSNKTLKSSAS